MSSTIDRRFIFCGRLAVAADLLVAAILAAFLFGATEHNGDAIPRPLAVGLLFTVPAGIGWFGLAAARRSLLAAAAVLSLVASLISFSLVSLVMLVPAALFAVATGAAPLGSASRRVPGVVLGPAVTALGLASGWVLLIGLTTSACWPRSGGQGCGEGLISLQGLIVAVALAGLAVALAAFGSPGSRQRADLRCPSPPGSRRLP